MEPRASKGAVAWLLRVVGLVVWAAVATPTFERAFEGAPPGPLWVALYLGFAAAFWVATDERAPLGRRRAALGAQSVAAIGLAVVGMPHFEGALLAVVAAQAPMVVRPRAALAWALAQAVPLVVIILPTHGPTGSLKATGEYLAFSAFAMAMVHLREREIEARREAASAHAMVLATQSLLLDDARTDERLRLARDVHDALGHGLTAAGLHLEIAKRAGNPEAIDAAAGAVRSTLAELRGLVGAMKHDAVIDLGAALRALASGVDEPVIHLDVPETLVVEGAERGHALFRCVQEALTNALRHASAKNVWIRVAVDGDDLIATVRDDGRGAAELSFGNGLTGVRERAEGLGGAFDVDARAGGGVALSLRVPRQAAL